MTKYSACFVTIALLLVFICITSTAAAPTAIVSTGDATATLGGTLAAGIGQRALRTGGETLTLHLAGKSSFRADLTATDIRHAVRDNTYVLDDGPFGWNSQKAVLFGVNATVEVYKNRKTLKIALAPAPTYNTTTMETIRVMLPQSLLTSAATLASSSFLVLPSNRLVVAQPMGGGAGEPFPLRIDGAEAASIMTHPDQYKFVLNPQCIGESHGVIQTFDPSTGTATVVVDRGAERYYLCYKADDEIPANYVAADGIITVAGPSSFKIFGGDNSIVSAKTRIDVEINGYMLTDEDTVMLLRPHAGSRTCADVPVAWEDQTDVRLLTSNSAAAELSANETGQHYLCYLRFGASAFVTIPGQPLRVAGDSGTHDTLLVESVLDLRNNFRAYALRVISGGVLRVNSHHLNVSSFEWPGGDITGQGKLNIRNDGNISGPAKTLTFEIVNYGKLVIYTDRLTFADTGRITNYGHITIVLSASQTEILDDRSQPQRSEWHRIVNMRAGTIAVRSVGTAHLLHSTVPWSNSGLVDVETAVLVLKRFTATTEATLRVHGTGARVAVNEGCEINGGRLEVSAQSVVALASDVHLNRARISCPSPATIAVGVSRLAGLAGFDSITVTGYCNFVVQGLAGIGELQVQGFNTFGVNTTLSLTAVNVRAPTFVSIIAHGTVLCNVSSVTFGDRVMLSAYLRAVFFGDGEQGNPGPVIVPQFAPANATLTIPSNASLILLDVTASAHKASGTTTGGPHLCDKYIVIPVHVVLQGEVLLWGCATMPFGGMHSGVTRSAESENIAAMMEFALCQMSITGAAPEGIYGAFVPRDVCVPLFATASRPVSGLLLAGPHVVVQPPLTAQSLSLPTASRSATPTPTTVTASMNVDVVKVQGTGRLRAVENVYFNIARELLVSEAAALSLIAGATVRVPYVNIQGLFEIDGNFPTIIEGDVVLQGPVEVSLAFDRCSPALQSTGVVTIHPGAEFTAPEGHYAGYGDSAALISAHHLIGEPRLSPVFGPGAKARIAMNIAVIQYLEDAPQLRLRIAAMIVALSAATITLCFHVLRVGTSAFRRELLHHEKLEDNGIRWHLSWPEFSAFVGNQLVVVAFIGEAIFLGAVAFHPMLQHPAHLEGAVSSFRFLFGLHDFTSGGARWWVVLECLCVAAWIGAWLPFFGAKYSSAIQRIFEQEERQTTARQAIVLLHQFHTGAAWVALVFFVPIVSTLLDAPMCSTLLAQKAGCEQMRELTPISSLCLLFFLYLAPYSGTASQTPFCHPPFTRDLDLRCKRTSAYVHYYVLFVITALWKVNGHDLNAVVMITLLGCATLFAIHWFTYPCAYNNVNLLRRCLLAWPGVAALAAATQLLRATTQQVCATSDAVFLGLLFGGWIVVVVGTIYLLRRTGKKANEFAELLQPQTHGLLTALRNVWREIEAERMQMYNEPNRRVRDAIALRIQGYRLQYLERLHEYRHSKEPRLALYYLGEASRFAGPSPSDSLDPVQMREANFAGVKKAVTEEDIERITPGQMAAFAEGPVLGRGTYGVVHMAMLPGGKLVAVKVVPVNKRHKNESIAAVRREVETLRKLRHKHIIQFFGCHTNKREIFIFMELATHGSLTQLARKFGELPESNIQLLTRQMLEGLQYLHQNGIVHRDVKGENILIDGNGVAKLGDFGCSKALAEAANHSQQGCATLVGSPYWMAPEVIRSEAYGTKADVWSLGCTVVEMLNGGRPPWNETFDNVYSAMFFIGNSTGLPSSIPTGVAAPCLAFLQRCFDRDPASRASVVELLEHPWLKETTNASPAGSPSGSSSDEGAAEPFRRGWSELFESDSEAAVSRGTTYARQNDGSLDIDENETEPLTRRQTDSVVGKAENSDV
jgi:serine/threonine protein kinase